MLGEPTYMKYECGGSVGHAPWLKPSGRPQPEAQGETPTPQVASKPNPLKAPRGIPSVAPKNMDPKFMQQQMMQQAMMGRGPGNTGQGPRTMDPAFMQQQAMQKAMMGQQRMGQQQPRMGMAEGKKAKKK